MCARVYVCVICEKRTATGESSVSVGIDKNFHICLGQKFESANGTAAMATAKDTEISEDVEVIKGKDALEDDDGSAFDPCCGLQPGVLQNTHAHTHTEIERAKCTGSGF